MAFNCEIKTKYYILPITPLNHDDVLDIKYSM